MFTKAAQYPEKKNKSKLQLLQCQFSNLSEAGEAAPNKLLNCCAESVENLLKGVSQPGEIFFTVFKNTTSYTNKSHPATSTTSCGGNSAKIKVIYLFIFFASTVQP